MAQAMDVARIRRAPFVAPLAFLTSFHAIVTKLPARSIS
jgi:hypothetical protein